MSYEKNRNLYHRIDKTNTTLEWCLNNTDQLLDMLLIAFPCRICVNHALEYFTLLTAKHWNMDFL